MSIKTLLLASAAAATLAGTAVAGQNSASSDYNNSWRWNESESLLNLQRADLIEKKEEGFYDRDYSNSYNYHIQNSTSIGCIQDGTGLNCTNTGSQGSSNRVNSDGDSTAESYTGTVKHNGQTFEVNCNSKDCTMQPE